MGVKRYWGILQRSAHAGPAEPKPNFALISAPIGIETIGGAGGVVEFRTPGDHLTVLTAPWSDWRRLTLHFDDPSNDGFPCRPGVSFDHPFEKFYLAVNRTPASVSFPRPQYQAADGWVRFYIGINGARARFHADSQAFVSSWEPRRIRLDPGTGFFLLPPTEGGFPTSQPEPSITFSEIGYRACTIISRGPGDVSIVDSVDSLTQESAVMEPGDVLTFRANDYQGARSLSVAATFGSPCILDMVRIQ